MLVLVLASVALAKKGQPIKDIFIKENKKETFKNILKYTKLDYEGLKGYAYMFFQAAGASIGSYIAGSLYDKNPDNRIEKFKEAVFTVNNVAIPTAIVKIIEYIMQNLKKTTNKTALQTISKNKILKNVAIFAGLISGIIISTSVSNTINLKIIDKENKKKKKIRPVDFLVHIDDIIPILISSKGSVFRKISLDRIMPLLYCISGSKVGKCNYYTHE